MRDLNKSESKYFNTAEKMDKAFLELLQKKDLSFITVKEICQRAGVNRSTFYLHYETIGDLLEESLEYMNNKFLETFKDRQSILPEIESCSPDELIWIKPEYLLPYLNYVKNNRQLYQAAMKNPAVFGADRTYKKMFEHIFDPVLERFGVPEEQRHYIMSFYVNGIAGIIEEWLKGDCKDDIEHITKMIEGCLPKFEKI